MDSIRKQIVWAPGRSHPAGDSCGVPGGRADGPGWELELSVLMPCN